MGLNAFFDWLNANSGLTSVMGVTVLGLITGIVKLAQICISHLQDRIDSSKLQPYYTRDTIAEARCNYIRTKCQNIDPANDENYRSSHAFSTKEDLLNFFLKRVFRLKEHSNRFYLVLADSGMGKSTFMLNLFSRYNRIWRVSFRKRKLKLLPLGESLEVIEREITGIADAGNTILLLDGFDEIPTANYIDVKEKFDYVINLVKGFSVVIITCRTHFFSSEQDEPFELKIRQFNTNGNGYHHVKKLYISPFDDQDIKKFIQRSFNLLDFKNRRAAHLIVKNTHDLMVRPMLLSHIRDIVEINRSKFSTSFEIYESLINSWLDRESNKYQSIRKREFKLNLTYFTFAVVNHIYDHYQENGLFIPLSDAIKLSSDFQIDLNEIEIKSRSLLNRNSIGDYKFSHKSIFEFFIAYLAYTERTFIDNTYTIKYDLTNFDVAKRFILDIVKSNKTEFNLPALVESIEGFNVQLYGEVMRQRDGANAQVHWVTNRSFHIFRETESLGLISEA